MNFNLWQAVGWLGNILFFSRFFVQWYASEKNKKVTMPTSFWWLSIAGSALLLAYSFHIKNIIFVFAYAFTWIPYLRNLMIGRKDRQPNNTVTKA